MVHGRGHWLKHAPKNPLVWVGLAAAFSVGLIHDRNLMLEYIKATAWPLVVGVALYWLREPIRAKVADLLKAKVAGWELEFRQQEAIQESLQDLAEKLPPVKEVKPGDVQPPVDEASPPDANALREPIAEMVQRAIDYGFNSARNGDDRPPQSSISWSPENIPTVSFSARIRAPSEANFAIRRAMREGQTMRNAIMIGDYVTAYGGAQKLKNELISLKVFPVGRRDQEVLASLDSDAQWLRDKWPELKPEDVEEFLRRKRVEITP
jgi:hypothetical protein